MESLDAITSYDGMGWDMIPSALWIYIYIYTCIYFYEERDYGQIAGWKREK